jgi:hypothetical protein
MEQPDEDGALPEGQGAAGAEEAAARPPEDDAPPSPAAQALALEAEEIRRLVEAGAGTPEAIRDLAARLREHRAREESLWRENVKPTLRRDRRSIVRSGSDPVRSRATGPSSSSSAVLGGVLLGLVLVVVIAANTTGWVLVLPLIALLVWAWQQGKDGTG